MRKLKNHTMTRDIDIDEIKEINNNFAYFKSDNHNTFESLPIGSLFVILMILVLL